MLRYQVLEAGPYRFCVIDSRRGGQTVFNGTYHYRDFAVKNAEQLNREYQRWLREDAELRAGGAVL